MVWTDLDFGMNPGTRKKTRKKKTEGAGRIMSGTLQIYKTRFASAGECSCSENGWLHCKTTPFYIFAQAYEGHYEVETPDCRAICETGGAFFSAPGTPLRIFHFTDPRSGQMRIRYLHFVLEDASGTDPFSFRTIPLALSARETQSPARELEKLTADGGKKPFADNIRILRILEQLYSLTEPNLKTEPHLDYLKNLCAWGRKRAGNHPPDVPELIAKSGYSRSKVFADFFSHMRMSPGDFILHERITLAERKLLEHPERSIQEIAYECGWKNPFHFSRAFKSVTGLSPRKYRLRPFC